MNAQQLKNSILQEAIEGRLVPQDPNDEPASVLLDKIRKEKARLVKEGKLKKKDLEEIPISEDEKPFEIPESWAWVRLITLSKIIHYGYTASAAPAGNAKLLRITDIQDDKVCWQTVPYCTIKEKDLESYQLHNRDILIARTGGTVGKTYIVRELSDISVFASYLIRAIPLENANEEYIKLFMSSPYYWSQLIDATSGTGQPNVNGQSLSKLIVPLPPLAEQKRIVAKIEELLPKVDEYGKAQESLDKLNEELPEKLKKSILQEAIEGRLVPQDPNDEPASVLLDKIRKEKAKLVKEGKLKKKDLEETPISEDEIPFKIPESWEWVRHNDLFDISGGSQPPKSDFSLEEKEGYIRLYQIRDYGEKPSPVYIPISKASKITQKGDILLARYGGSLGKVFIAEDGAYNVAMAKVEYLFNKSLIDHDYLYYYYNCSLYQDLVKGNNRSAQGGFNKEDLGSLLFPLPPLAEQHRIVQKIEQLMNEIDKLKV